MTSCPVLSASVHLRVSTWTNGGNPLVSGLVHGVLGASWKCLEGPSPWLFEDTAGFSVSMPWACLQCQETLTKGE